MLNYLDILKDCRKYSIPWWQCPQVIFLIIGLLIIVAILATYFIGTKVIDDPSIVALLVVSLAAVLIVLDYIIMKSFERLAEAAMMRSDFVSIISHQMRTPLSNLKWAIELIGRTIQKNLHAKESKSGEYFAMLRENTERLAELIQKMILASKLEGQTLPVRAEAFSLQQLCQKTIQEFSAFAAARNLAIRMEVEPDLPAVLADPFLIRQVVANLLDNAIKYSIHPGEILVRLTGQGRKVHCAVQDSGIGIKNQEQSRIFAKFFRGEAAAKKQVSGTGLGLFIAKGIIERNGGKIGFSSKQGQGSTFWFTLPTVES